VQYDLRTLLLLTAVVALLVLAALAGRRRLLGRVAWLAGALLIAGLLGYAQPWVLKLLLSVDHGIEAMDELVVALSLAGLLCATVLPLRLARRRG